MSSKNSQNVINFVKRRKSNLIKVFHSKCCICGFDKFQEALEFHHVNPEEKSFGLTTQTTTKALSAQLEEMKKCVLVCANCHRGIHNGYLEIPQNWQELYDNEIANQLLEELKQLREGKKHYCQRCGTIISEKASYCTKCARLISRKVDRPSREELKELIRKLPFTQIAEKYKVSDNAIRKWCDAENLPRKKTIINQMSNEEWEKI